MMEFPALHAVQRVLEVKYLCSCKDKEFSKTAATGFDFFLDVVSGKLTFKRDNTHIATKLDYR